MFALLQQRRKHANTLYSHLYARVRDLFECLCFILRTWPRCKAQVRPSTALQRSLIMWMYLFHTHGPLGVGENSFPYACDLI